MFDFFKKNEYFWLLHYSLGLDFLFDVKLVVVFGLLLGDRAFVQTRNIEDLPFIIANLVERVHEHASHESKPEKLNDFSTYFKF